MAAAECLWHHRYRWCRPCPEEESWRLHVSVSLFFFKMELLNVSRNMFRALKKKQRNLVRAKQRERMRGRVFDSKRTRNCILQEWRGTSHIICRGDNKVKQGNEDLQWTLHEYGNHIHAKKKKIYYARTVCKSEWQRILMLDIILAKVPPTAKSTYERKVWWICLQFIYFDYSQGQRHY